MPIYRERLFVSGDRFSIRRQVILKFLDEVPGIGKGEDSSRYHYEVEVTKSNDHIILKRPANFNKGMDFTVHAEGVRFKDRGIVDRPSHENIKDDLNEKKRSEPELYDGVAGLIRRIYRCEDVSPREFEQFNFRSGHSLDVILFSIKWLFIEQDVTYWNWSGRAMLYAALKADELC